MGLTFCHLSEFLSVHTVNILGHIVRYAPSSADTLSSKQIQKSDNANLQNPPKKIKIMTALQLNAQIWRDMSNMLS